MAVGCMIRFGTTQAMRVSQALTLLTTADTYKMCMYKQVAMFSLRVYIREKRTRYVMCFVTAASVNAAAPSP